MTEHKVTISSTLETRTVALFVQNASKFVSNIMVQVDNKKVNAKSIMGMISLNIMEGQEVTLIAEGKDESEAVQELDNFVKTMR